jgi:HEPN domain-containing protein
MGLFQRSTGRRKSAESPLPAPGGEAWGLSIKRLLEELPPEMGVSPELIDCARILDRFYIPTRYPNGFDDGKPADYYTDADSQQAIRCAEAILRFCADRMAG